MTCSKGIAMTGRIEADFERGVVPASARADTVQLNSTSDLVHALGAELDEVKGILSIGSTLASPVKLKSRNVVAIIRPGHRDVGRDYILPSNFDNGSAGGATPAGRRATLSVGGRATTGITGVWVLAGDCVFVGDRRRNAAPFGRGLPVTSSWVEPIRPGRSSAPD